MDKVILKGKSVFIVFFSGMQWLFGHGVSLLLLLEWCYYCHW